MKHFLILSIFFFSITVNAQTVLGTWKTIDDKSNVAKSHVEIYEKNGKIYGRVKEIFKASARDNLCVNCKGEDKNTPILGMDVIKALERDGDVFKNGKITDPESGKEYRAKIWLDQDDPNRLFVRGYIAFFYRTQEWLRVE